MRKTRKGKERDEEDEEGEANGDSRYSVPLHRRLP
jgi:hypothetical protein